MFPFQEILWQYTMGWCFPPRIAIMMPQAQTVQWIIAAPGGTLTATRPTSMDFITAEANAQIPSVWYGRAGQGITIPWNVLRWRQDPLISKQGQVVL